MTIVDYNAGTVKDMGLAQAKVVTMDDKTTMEITLNPGFDWVKGCAFIFRPRTIAKKSQISDAVPRSYYP